ncbi:ras family-domain-containing protein [Ochromonadaceae sp. CCMP2298]|nr:ras family-domain-containing protein [Ochromonadaceae sp. CCMP2298]|eukprot:CAMPEP_0173188792 /NCGR_PEP_ID=MMETSP1141-20130122/11439_1 /TAXON_ID=483371 /ORGANISM="non described non described, Strain CCMP2298" /LENGTH=199 /DNA_ID=CAMNT_0014112735 /DNA_START=70 /DNA_END=669 /DNA_ORIENTATION=-
MDSKAREVKVVLLGDSGVGKSSLVLRFVTNNFKPYSESTIGASFMSKMITVSGKQIKFQIWDTAGQEKYHSLAPMYYRGAAAAVVVYDITRAASFKTLRHWVDELRSKGPKDIAIAIAANKADLESKREVDKAMAIAYAEEIGAMYLETSAKDDFNVQDIFVQLSFRLPAAPEARDTSVLKATNSAASRNAQAKSGGCC